MSHARDLALLEKWTDASMLPTISPTSPKVTTFCCCPQRRRYNLNQKPKKHKNLLYENDFSYIDDGSTKEEPTNSNNSCANTTADDGNDDVVAWNVAKPSQISESEKLKQRIVPNDTIASNIEGECEQHFVLVAGNEATSTATSASAEQWLRHDKGCNNSGSNNNASNTKRCSLVQQAATTRTTAQQQENDGEASESIQKSCNDTIDVAVGCAATTIEQQQQHMLNEEQQIQQIQRLSNNINNKENKISNSNSNSHYTSNKNNNNNCNTNIASYTESSCANVGNCCHNNCRYNYCQQQQQRQLQANDNSDNCKDDNDSRLDFDQQQNKMTITTTTVSSRKRSSECGLSAAETVPTTSDVAKASTATTTTTTTTPSVTTVIKTTMVKRSPNESTTATTPTATTPTATTPTSTFIKPLATFQQQQQQRNNSNSNSNQHSTSNKCSESTTATATTMSVKERIAAFAAGNNQLKTQDYVLKKNQCNNSNNNNHMTNRSAMKTTTTTTKATTSEIYTHTNSANNQIRATSPVSTSSLSSLSSTTSGTASGSGSGSTSVSVSATSCASDAASPLRCSNNNTNTDDILLQQCALNDAQNTADTANVASFRLTRASGNPGAATMPRRRSPALATSPIERQLKYGSNSAALTADKKFLNHGPHHKPSDVDKAAMRRDNLAALDNLDLALSLDLNDEDGEDPYYVLQEYLERVKLEINEVFELHKARQRMQQPQQQQQQQQQQHIDHADELTRSTESDSGFDSASGHSNKLPNCATTATAAPTDEKVTEISAVNSHSDINGHSTAATLAAAAVATTAEAVAASNNKKQLLRLDIAAAAATTSIDDEQTTPTTTKLHALPPPPLSPSALLAANIHNNNSDTSNTASTTLQRLREQLQAKADAGCSSAAAADEVNIWANKFLRDLDNLMGSDKSSSSPTSTASPMLLTAAATAAINSRSNSAKNEQQREQFATNSVVLRPEKHTTIPLQSFNLDCGGFVDSHARPNAANVGYLRTLSAPAPYEQQQQQQQHEHNDNRASMANGNCICSLATFNGDQKQQHHHSLGNFQRTLTPEPTTTILKIEEAAAAAAAAAGQARHMARPGTTNLAHEELQRQRRQRQLENDMETIRSALLSQSQQLTSMEASNNTTNNNNNNNNSRNNSHGKNMLVASTAATLIPKRERINQPLTTTTSISPSSSLMTPSKSTTTTSYLLNGSDATKKGSTSTIWTSEESILRSVGAVDEDNNSTSSSACEEASGVLSSGKSGISLDSSGLDNDNNESGIGTATPPKDLSYWKNAHHHHHHQNDNESVSSLDALRKMKFQKSGSVASSDDPDLLEVLSLCDEPHGDEDVCVNADESLDVDDIEDRHNRDYQEQHQQQLQNQRHHNHHLQHHHHHHHHTHQHSGQHDNDDSNEVLAQEDADDDDEVDEGHDEFEVEIGSFCDCDCTDGDVSSSSVGAASNGSRNGAAISGAGGPATITDASSVVLRRKFNAAPPITVPYGRAQKCRSHSLDTSSLPSSYQHQHHFHHYHQHHPSQLARKLHHHLHPPRTKERGQLSLTLRQEPFQSLLSPSHFHELPSPSSASLHSGHESLGIQELTTKSNSAPLLLKQEKKRDDFAGQNLTLRYSRSQSDRYLAEIEAVEACKWLRAAGFPQYAQMYEDHQFPLDLTNVAKDHTNLENDQLQSLYRRLCILNRCANMRLDQSHKPQTPQKEDSDDENFALSENWTFQPHIRRWSRIGEMGLEIPPAGKLNAEKTESSSKESSPDRFDDDSYDMTGAGLSLALAGAGGDSTDTTLNESAVRLRRSGSERFKDGAKALLRRVESIKSRRRKRQNREGIVISGPQALDLSQLGQRSSMRKPDAVYSTPPSPSAVSPMHSFPKSPFFGNELKVPSQSESFLSPNRASPKRTPTTPRSMRTSPLHFFSNPMPHLREGKSDDSSSYFSDSQESSAGGKLTPSLLRKTPSKTRRFLQRTGKVDDIGAHSDSECHQGRKLLIKDANSNTTEVKMKKLTRGGSLNLGKDPKKRDGFRSSSFRSRSTTRKDVKTTDDADNVKRTPVVRWHSFQMEERPHMIFRKCFSQKIDPNAIDQGVPFAALSAGQLQIIRKLALVILTGHMERYCPTHRSGWNWELPKFIKKIKMPDYKDKKVFGVPLLLILQRTGQTLPIAVRSAFRWLQVNALDQIGLFRKSGVKSRIIKLKELIEYSESSAECMEVFDAQQAYDVADMLKQYFRDLPESLLTTKMSETFAAIFQHLPPDVRLDAVQCAVLLLPDENREILFALLEFLTLVADNSSYNQMTANNLAVCLAPSLFHNSISTGASSVSASPRRRKGAGVPDVKELSEAKASHECLAFMIENYRKIYTASKDKINKCNFGYMEESKPVPLEALGEGMQFHNWRGYLYECTSATIKEGREKARGWFTITSLSDPSVEIAYKKVGDGHPLRLWRCITEVEGPPKDVLDYIIRQRASWDVNLLQCQTVKKLDERTEIFQYAVDGQLTTDFCVLRSWQTDLPRKACVIVETSIEHAKAKPIYGSVRGVVLASRYLIEPCGSGRSRVMHLARVDIKGKTPEWYNKSYGHICSHYLSKIRFAFKSVAEGPESKV